MMNGFIWKQAPVCHLGSFYSSARDVIFGKASIAPFSVPVLKILVVASGPGVWSVFVVAHQSIAIAVALRPPMLLIEIMSKIEVQLKCQDAPTDDKVKVLLTPFQRCDQLREQKFALCQLQSH